MKMQTLKQFGKRVWLTKKWKLIFVAALGVVLAVMNQGFLQGFFRGSSDATVLGMVSIFYALALGLCGHRRIGGCRGQRYSILFCASPATKSGADDSRWRHECGARDRPNRSFVKWGRERTASRGG